MPGPRPVLIVDDDTGLSATLAEQLSLDGEFAPVEAASLAEAEARVSADGARFDLILLDIRLPDGDGRDYCARLRRDGYRMPVVMLTGADSEADVVSGLDAGANDFIVKPFRLNELLARIRAQLRGYDSSEDAVFKVGPYLFRPSAKQLHDQARGKRIRLTEKEAAILKFLYRAGGRPVPRTVLLNDVWGYNSNVTTHTLETHIYRLRQKIEPNPAETRLLVTEAGGYRLEQLEDAGAG
ncbi:response regulator transcription factor [Roseomonas rosulenta]|uniref:response regulator transcription factor n=1 Tax=Roseomonas rosulenta TaxID=2748667 RepID=UPI0018DFD13C|nr:response regulator transcription factor [Roseomonas rosulenta]